MGETQGTVWRKWWHDEELNVTLRTEGRLAARGTTMTLVSYLSRLGFSVEGGVVPRTIRIRGNEGSVRLDSVRAGIWGGEGTEG